MKSTDLNNDLFEQAWKAYNRKGAKKVAKSQWDRLPADARIAALAHIPFYVTSRERQYCKDFERYLRDRVFENPVFDAKGNILFDPEEQTTDTTVTLEGFQG